MSPDNGLMSGLTHTDRIRDDRESCLVPDNDPLFTRYHDQEWGVPTTCDRVFFEKICLEGFQSGLSWRTILHRRDGFRQAFDHFDPFIIVQYSESDVERLMHDKRIIRNRRKILSVINNARRCIDLQSRYGTLSSFIWAFEPSANERPARITRQWLADNPNTPASTALSTALKKQGWTFVGPTTMYALMQALGIVNDHVEQCPQRAVIQRLRNAEHARPSEI